MIEKLVSRKELAKKVQTLKSTGKRIVFTNGCFDLLHVGHVRYLKGAKNEGDVLIVGLNSDQSVRQIKGAGRPVVGEKARAEVLAALACVDYVTLFNEPDPLVTIQMIAPHVLVKGADWEENAIVGKEVVEANGGRIVRIPMTGGASTSKLIKKIISTHCRD
jgi:D-beta-D-heptose 7-phosphate kinase/D-beta-D-heptose 1-phosphate adenosyltransferase